MKINRLAIIFTILTLAPSSLYAASLCTPSEKVIWSCSLKNKIYSVCASKDLDMKNGYLQYRVAKNNQIEFLYPQEKTHPVGKFNYSLLAKGAMLSFKNSNYEYQLYEGVMGEPSIYITKNENPVFDQECDRGSYTLTNTKVQNFLSGAGIEK